MNMKLKINLRIGYLYFLLFPYLKPYNITLIPLLNNIFKVWKIIATIIIIIPFFQAKKKLHKQSIFLLAFLFTWLISLIINQAPIIDFGNNILSIVGVLLLFESNYSNIRFKIDILKVLYNVSFVYIILNFITVLMGRPFLSSDIKLNDNANFLGGDNYSAFILIVMCGFLFLHDIKNYEKIRIITWLIALIGLCCLWIQFALTGLIAYTILLVSILFLNYATLKKIIKKLLNWKIAALFCLFSVLLISYFNLDKIMANLLGSLDKVGFNGRNMIWPRTISAILKKPLIGYGGVDVNLASTWFIAGANHTHNFLLEFPFSTGIIGSAFFVLYQYYLLKNIETKNNDAERLLIIVLSVYIICGTFDFYIGLIWFYLLLDIIWLYKRVI